VTRKRVRKAETSVIKRRRLDELPPDVPNVLMTPAIIAQDDDIIVVDEEDDLPPLNALHVFLAILACIFQACPALEGKIALCRLTKAQCARICLQTFRDMNISAYFVDFQTKMDQALWEDMKSLLLPTPSLTKPAHAAKRWKIPPWQEYIEWSCAKVSEGKENQAMEVHQMMRSYVDSCFWMFELSTEKVVDNRAGGATQWKRYSAAEDPGRRCIRILLNPRFAKKVQPSRALPVLDANAPGYADDDAEDPAQRAHREVQDPLIQALFNIEDGMDEDDDDELTGRQARINLENQLVRQRMTRSARTRPFANSYDAEDRQRPPAPSVAQGSQGLGRGIVHQDALR
ncbi:hypothetical protein CYLTODRAFT_414498, partial [Cylindrobasidium torrendii FP15055 ss-10]